MFNGIQYTGSITVCIPAKVAHHTDDRLVAVDFNGTKITQFLLDFVQVPGVVYGQRNSNFRCRYHVYRRFIPFKHLEDPAQKAVSEQHPGRMDTDSRDTVFSGNG